MPGTGRRGNSPPGRVGPLFFFFFFFFFFFWEEEALHVSLICHRSNISGQLKEISGMKAYKARPTTGEAALPWQAIRMCHSDLT